MKPQQMSPYIIHLQHCISTILWKSICAITQNISNFCQNNKERINKKTPMRGLWSNLHKAFTRVKSTQEGKALPYQNKNANNGSTITKLSIQTG